MIDQLHQFEDLASAVAAFPWPAGEDGLPVPATVWGSGGLAVMISDVRMLAPALDMIDPATGEPVRGTAPASGTWLGLAIDDDAVASALRARPSFRLQYLRPAGPTPWRAAVTHAAPGLDIAAMPVASAGSFAGSGYLFD
ncbi:MAG: hypothetical protein HEQ16_04955 [Bosea sp.]|nr:hypothetical protein [Bosea sp. (in: a-proteobacteria)]